MLKVIDISFQNVLVLPYLKEYPVMTWENANASQESTDKNVADVNQDSTGNNAKKVKKILLLISFILILTSK